MDNENKEKFESRFNLPSKSTSKTKAAIDAILSSNPKNSDQEKIKPFVIEPQKNNRNDGAIPIITLPDQKIPKLDLNRKLMAANRQFSSVTRKGPNIPKEKPQQPAAAIHGRSADSAVERHIPSANPLIKEIVAKDIEKMYQNARLQK